MVSALGLPSKRELLARSLLWSGVSALIARLPQRSQLLILNYHRIGNAAEDRFDPDLFSASADEFDCQIAYLKRHTLLVTLEEAVAFIEGTVCDARPRCRSLITFDDGYLDNYEVAFPVLRSRGAQGVFFLTTGVLGSNGIPWWDRVAYIVKATRKRRFAMSHPVSIEVDLDRDGLLPSLRRVSTACYWLNPADTAIFLQALAQRTEVDEPSQQVRRYLTWQEAQEMLAGGMAIGSHTNCHPVLGRLTPEDQAVELRTSRETIKNRLNIAADVVAYPYGTPSSFSEETQKLAREAGYRAAFTLRPGSNLQGKIDPYGIKRIAIGGVSRARFQVQTAVCRLAGQYWP